MNKTALRSADTLLVLLTVLAGTAATAPAQLLVAAGPVTDTAPITAEYAPAPQPPAVQPPGGGIELSGPTGGARIEPSGSPQAEPLRLPAQPGAAAQARLQRLRSAALAPAKRGSSAERAAARSAWLLGLLYLHGEGVPLDRAQALHWFQRAQALGEPLASAGLAWCQIDGCQGPPQPAAARPWIERLAPAEPGLALLLQWWMHERLAPLRTPGPATPARAGQEAAERERLALLERAARLGNASALNELGLAQLAAQRLPEALAQFRQAAGQSPAAAANARLLAARLQQQAPQAGAGVGAGAAQRSAEQWLAQARRYHRGEGVPSNYTEAIRLYQIAAASGSQEAKRMLELIYSRPAPSGTVDVAWMRQLATMQLSPEGAVLSLQPPPTPRLFVHDATPLQPLLPPEWRADAGVGAP